MIYEIIADGKLFLLDNTNIKELDTNLEFIPQIREALKGSKLVGFKYLNKKEEEEDDDEKEN